MRGSKLLSNIKFYTDYSKWDEKLERKQSWEERVEDVMRMHQENPKFKEAFKNPWFADMFEKTKDLYKRKMISGSQRAFQFNEYHIGRHNSKIYNCTVTYCDRPRMFQEAMYQLLCGCGVGVSFLKKFTNQLPNISSRDRGTKTFTIADDIEGWANAVGVLMSSYFEGEVPFPEYQRYIINFDYSQIRPEGAYISGGFKAPGHTGLKRSLEKIENLLNKTLSRGQFKITPIIPYDIIMHCADAVLSGGVRRSATIALFDFDDEEMMNAKVGNWFSENPQRARSNNSALLIRSQITKEQFDNLMERTKQFGEPGFIFSESEDFLYNPCVEIGMLAKLKRLEEEISGWQSCNLSGVIGKYSTSLEIFVEQAECASFIGTLQASYTNLPYLGEVSEEIHKKEALIGVSITGFMNSPKVLLNPDYLRTAALAVKDVNRKTAFIIGINVAARTTCVKPSGNESTMYETASGIHGEHSEDYFRIVQLNKEDDIAKMIASKVPDMIEESVWSANKTDYAIFVPIKTKKGSIYKKDLLGVKQLEIVKLVQENWVEVGTNIELCSHPKLRHNVSNTISVDNWEQVGDFIFNNKEVFAGISLLSHTGDKVYNQAPFTEVIDSTKIVEKYGDASMFVSGLIVDGLELFNNNLWQACDFISQEDRKLEGTNQQILLKQTWISRAKKFAKRYFKDIEDLIFCMKDVHLYHKWVNIERVQRNLDIEPLLSQTKPEYTAIDTLGAQSCYGGACEIEF